MQTCWSGETVLNQGHSGPHFQPWSFMVRITLLSFTTLNWQDTHKITLSRGQTPTTKQGCFFHSRPTTCSYYILWPRACKIIEIISSLIFICFFSSHVLFQASAALSTIPVWTQLSDFSQWPDQTHSHLQNHKVGKENVVALANYTRKMFGWKHFRTYSSCQNKFYIIWFLHSYCILQLLIHRGIIKTAVAACGYKYYWH